jgi:hypothetical protein
MEELIKMVTQKVGISPDQAQATVRMVVNFLKDKLPKPVAGQIDSALGLASGDQAQGVAKKLGGLFGKK